MFDDPNPMPGGTTEPEKADTLFLQRAQVLELIQRVKSNLTTIAELTAGRGTPREQAMFFNLAEPVLDECCAQWSTRITLTTESVTEALDKKLEEVGRRESATGITAPEKEEVRQWCRNVIVTEMQDIARSVSARNRS